ncbi:hypothetical protein GF406_06050 [candidate division KSB1 bacterium]|nr:hypothetical protein [candidate division KSB1 bacterium]
MKIIKKKTILAFAMSMILSLATLQGINQNNVQQQDMNIQQLGLTAALAASKAESGSIKAVTFSYLAYTAGTTCATMAAGGLASIYVSATTPVGWGYWVATGLVGL